MQKRSIFKQILRRLVLWGGIFVVLGILFLTIPGIEYSLRFPGGSRDPWILLERLKPIAGMDMRRIKLGPWQTGLVLTDTGPGSWFDLSHLEGAHLEDGTLYYIGDGWMFNTGAEPAGVPRFMVGPLLPP